MTIDRGIMSDTCGHLVIATGGTGGHFFPALAIGKEFQRQGGVVSLFIAGQRTEAHVEEARREGFVAFPCSAFRLPGGALQALAFPLNMTVGVWRARRQMRRLQPNFVLGMGSFASVPPCLAAAFSGVPLFLHDGNAVVGRANRLLSHWARCMALSLPLAKGEKARCPVHVTGMPVREQILRRVAVPPVRETLLAELGLARDRLTLLVFGGSQGAAFINGVVEATVPRLGDTADHLQIIHLTGSDQNDSKLATYAAAGLPAIVKAFDGNIDRYFTAADLVVCRAGGATIAELALFGKPVVFIPIPNSSMDHQRANAQVLADADAAVLLPQAEASPDRLAELIRSRVENPDQWLARAGRLRRFSTPKAAADVVEMIFANAAPMA